MKSPVIIFRRGLRELTGAGKMTLTIAVLCLFTGFALFLQTASKTPPLTSPIPPPTNERAMGPSSGEVAAHAETDVAALPPAIPAVKKSPSSLPVDSAVSQSVVEINLPPPPSGDYELNLTAEQINATVEKRYGGLFQSLGLPPEQLARLRWLLAERQQASVDAANAALQAGVNPVRELPTIRSAIDEAEASIDSILRNEMGESVFNACRDFDRTLRERNLVGDFSRLLAVTGEPLQPELDRQVVQILKNFPAKDAPMDVDRAIFGGIKTRARISAQAMTEAATVLSPRQLEILRQLQRHDAAEETRR